MNQEHVPPNTRLIREVAMTSKDRDSCRKWIEAKETADVACDAAQKAISSHRKASADLAKDIAEREQLGDGKAMHEAGILLDFDMARGTILILQKVDEVQS